MGHTRCYRDGELYREGFPVAEVSDLLKDPANTVWFDICEPDEKDLATVQEELGLHTLAVEDVLHPGQRPKVDHYPEHLLVIAYGVGVGEGNELRSHEVGIFVTRNALVTVRSDEHFDITEVMRRWDRTPTLAANGVGFLLHGVLDYAVDTQFQTVERLDSEIDLLEERVFDEVTKDSAVQKRAFQVRKSLVLLRRLVLPMREVISTLMRRNPELTGGAMMPYFQDVYDHAVRVGEWTDSLRDLAANLLETRLSVRNNRLNVTVKKVTGWAAIIAVPTAVTGFYGQNVPYPGYGAAWGFWASTVVIVVACVALYAVFKRMDWL